MIYRKKEWLYREISIEGMFRGGGEGSIGEFFSDFLVQFRGGGLAFLIKNGDGAVLFRDDYIVVGVLLIGQAIMLAELFVLIGAESLADAAEGEDALGRIDVGELDVLDLLIGDDFGVIETLERERILLRRDLDGAEEDRENEGKDGDREDRGYREKNAADTPFCHITTNPFP